MKRRWLLTTSKSRLKHGVITTLYIKNNQGSKKVRGMNKNIQKIYDQALAVVLDEFGMTAEYVFAHNTTECVQARMALMEALVEEGFSDQDIAELTHMRRCSVCKIRNKFDDKRAPWTVKLCIEHIKKMSDKSLLFSN